jgi:hypothetical protein
LGSALARNLPLGQLVEAEPFKTADFEARLIRPFSPRPLCTHHEGQRLRAGLGSTKQPVGSGDGTIESHGAAGDIDSIDSKRR